MSVMAKVAKIVSEYEVAFNVGEAAGVAVGDIASVYRVIDINDPETGERLGEVRRSSIRFEITEVQDQLSIGSTFETVGSGLTDNLTLNWSPQRVRISAAQSVRPGVVKLSIGDDAEIIRPPQQKPST